MISIYHLYSTKTTSNSEYRFRTFNSIQQTSFQNFIKNIFLMSFRETCFFKTKKQASVMADASAIRKSLSSSRKGWKEGITWKADRITEDGLSAQWQNPFLFFQQMTTVCRICIFISCVTWTKVPDMFLYSFVTLNFSGLSVRLKYLHWRLCTKYPRKFTTKR